jgi:AcrR family transcriptional regulator
MTPRRYRMDARQDAVAATRDRIVRAAMRLHADQGVLSTGWDDIAEAAGVSTATVYRHFPGLGHLVPACARRVFDVIQPPTVEQAGAQFARLDRAPDRFEHLVRESCHCYQRGERWLHAAHRERDFVPALDEALGVIQDTLHVLVDAAAGTRPAAESHALLFTLCDFPLWRSLIAAGLDHQSCEESVVALVRAETHRLGLS